MNAKEFVDRIEEQYAEHWGYVNDLKRKHRHRRQTHLILLVVSAVLYIALLALI